MALSKRSESKGQAHTMKKKGFTLVELLIVIAIIALLATLAIISFTTAQRKSRDAKRKEDISQIQKALEIYYFENGEYPPSGGAATPSANWSNSSDTSWDTLQTSLDSYISLPVDPSNDTGGWAGTGGVGGSIYNDDYYSNAFGCDQQWYMIVYRLEDTDIDSPGISACSGQNFNYTGTITAGKCQGCQ